MENPPKDHKHRVSKKLRHQSKLLNFSDIKFPSDEKDLKKFEKNNPEYLIYCYGYVDNKYFIYYKNSCFHGLQNDRQVLNLLYYEKHFYPIINIKAFHKVIFETEKNFYVCQSCLNHYATQDRLDEHYTYCQHEFPIRTTYPKPGSTLKFTKHHATMKNPFVVYVDTESNLEKIDETHGNTTRYQKHNPSAYGMLFIDRVNETSEYTLVNTADELIQKLNESAKIVSKTYVDLVGDELEKAKRAKTLAKTCKHCCAKFTQDDYPVMHHDHFTGKFISIVHNSCNLKIRQKLLLPVFAHNMSKYDEKAIIRSVHDKGTIIAKNIENFISFDYVTEDNVVVRFLDYYKFLQGSLAKLVDNLRDKGNAKLNENFALTKACFEGRCEDWTLLCLQKGVFPYDYCTDDSVLDNTTTLPPKEAFYSSLTQTHICDKDYTFAQKFWNDFKCDNLRQYMELYLQLDVHLLADVFEQFRRFIFSEYNLDPVYYLTLSSLAFDCALLHSGVQLELLSDPTMYNFIESGIRGGVSMICKRYAEANNKTMKSYSPEKPSSYIIYVDANNLYGTPMLGNLPVKNFRWDNDLENWDKDGDCIVDADIHLPKDLYEKFKDYPLCPDHLDGKLMTTFYDKLHYVCHSKYLKEAVSHGYEITKVHKVLRFDSEPWLRSYVLKNTDLRSKATSTFDKDLWKYMNNAVYGKTIENVRKRVNIKMTSREKDFEKLVAKPTFKNVMELSESQYLLEMSRTSVTMNKPIYNGLAILDLSKIIMSNFYYKYFQAKFGDRLELLMTDTDSFMCHIESEDYYAEIKDDIHKWFDTSGFSPEAKLPDDFELDVNKKVPGKFKDEMGGIPITKFVGLRAKQYAYETEDTVTMKCKGISKQGMKTIAFNDYVESLDKENFVPKFTQMNIIRSHKHKVYTETIRKKVLDPNDDKRQVLKDGIRTTPWGYE